MIIRRHSPRTAPLNTCLVCVDAVVRRPSCARTASSAAGAVVRIGETAVVRRRGDERAARAKILTSRAISYSLLDKLRQPKGYRPQRFGGGGGGGGGAMPKGAPPPPMNANAAQPPPPPPPLPGGNIPPIIAPIGGVARGGGGGATAMSMATTPMGGAARAGAAGLDGGGAGSIPSPAGFGGGGGGACMRCATPTKSVLEGAGSGAGSVAGSSHCVRPVASCV